MLKESEQALAEMDDLETARIGAVSRLQQLEAIIRLEPQNKPVRAMLVTGWARYGLLFVEDDVEEARERADVSGANYHALRARNAYERAIHHGRALFGESAFEQALTSKALPAYLASLPDISPEALLWMGAAWLGRARVSPEDRRALASQARIGEQLIEQSIELGEDTAWAEALLGTWASRLGDNVRAQQHFEDALLLSDRKLLFVQVMFARTVVCAAHDRARWDALFKEVLDARDPDPSLRIDNAVAKRKAARDLLGTRRAQCVP